MKLRFLVSMVIIALVAVLVAGGTMAVFTAAEETEAENYVAGIVAVSGGEIVISKGDIAPGGTVEGTFEVKNEGTLDLWFTVEPIATGTLFAGIEPDADNHAVVEEVVVPEVILAPDETAEVTFTVHLPEEASAVYQNAEGDLQFEINAQQADHNPAPWKE